MAKEVKKSKPREELQVLIKGATNEAVKNLQVIKENIFAQLPLEEIENTQEQVLSYQEIDVDGLFYDFMVEIEEIEPEIGRRCFDFRGKWKSDDGLEKRRIRLKSRADDICSLFRIGFYTETIDLSNRIRKVIETTATFLGPNHFEFRQVRELEYKFTLTPLTDSSFDELIIHVDTEDGTTTWVSELKSGGKWSSQSLDETLKFEPDYPPHRFINIEDAIKKMGRNEAVL